MPSPTTVLAISRNALALTNAVGIDQTLSADESNDCLAAFNDLIEIFSTRNLAVYGGATQTFNTVAATATYTIGTGGTWNTARPVRINSPAYSVISGVSYPCASMTQEEYDLIPVKAQAGSYAERYLYVNSFPLGVVTLWPVPSAIVAMTFDIDTVLTSVTSVGTSISYAPGYAMAFTYKLAVMLAPRFGKKIANYPDVLAIANSTFADICRANKKLNVMSFGPEYVGSGAQSLQRFLGGY